MYCCNWLWRLRGALDLPAGGTGMRRGRRDPWAPKRNESIHDSERMGLSPLPSMQRRIIRQTALVDPIGLSGLAYWYLLYPMHRIVFAGLLRALVRWAQAER